MTMWVVDGEDDKIYAHNLSSKARDSGKDFNTLSAAGNQEPVWFTITMKTVRLRYATISHRLGSTVEKPVQSRTTRRRA